MTSHRTAAKVLAYLVVLVALVLTADQNRQYAFCACRSTTYSIGGATRLSVVHQ
jgi:hypothetical protein